MPISRLRVFISSVQKEFAQERLDLRSFILGDPVLQLFIADVFSLNCFLQLDYVKSNGVITNTEYQSQLDASKRTATRDLEEMVSQGVLEKIGTTGRGVHYRLGKGVKKGPKEP